MLAINSCVIESSFESRRSRLSKIHRQQLLVDRMVPIADGGLRHLSNQRLGVAQQQMHHRTVTLEFVLEQWGPEA